MTFSAMRVGMGTNHNLADPFFSSVVLLTPFDGDDGDAFSSDLSDSAHSLTFVSDAEIQTVQSKFGGSSLRVRKTDDDDKVSIADNADWNFGSGDWTLDCHVRFDGDPGTAGNSLLSQFGSGQRNWMLQYFNNNLFFYYSTNGSNLITNSGAFNPAGNTWYHIATDRSGSTLRGYVDGVVKYTADISTDVFHDSTALAFIGGEAETAANTLIGWMDNVRITKGVARYAGAFNPPTEAYPTF